jgi:hypothetical protein
MCAITLKHIEMFYFYGFLQDYNNYLLSQIAYKEEELLSSFFPPSFLCCLVGKEEGPWAQEEHIGAASQSLKQVTHQEVRDPDELRYPTTFHCLTTKSKTHQDYKILNIWFSNYLTLVTWGSFQSMLTPGPTVCQLLRRGTEHLHVVAQRTPSSVL